MILPIVAYGDPVLKKEAEEIDEDYPDLDQLIDNMYETMYNASGVGLAAPQIGRSIRLFIVDLSPFAENAEDEKTQQLDGYKEVFINPIIEDESGEDWGFEEGCLSIPKIREEVFRKEGIRITYYDRNWNFKDESMDGYAARVILHEYDHVDGILFTDHLTPLKKRMLKKRLNNIAQGDVDISYRMNFPKVKNKR